ncbi:MAG: type II toxin-antitoxin system VapC family toxin [Granulicella sp.]
MILVDTAVWIDHFIETDPMLQRLLDEGQVFSHPLVIGELAVGNLKPRDSILKTLSFLPVIPAATDDEVLQFIANRRLFGIGIGYIDAHLLAAVQLTPDAKLWTHDKRLHAAAGKLDLAIKPSARNTIH